MPQKPFDAMDLTSKYIVHDVTLYAHNHPSEPDGINAAVKEIEAELKAFDLDDFDYDTFTGLAISDGGQLLTDITSLSIGDRLTLTEPVAGTARIVANEPAPAFQGMLFIPYRQEPDCIAELQTPSGAGNLTLTGFAPIVPRQIEISSSGDCSGVTFTMSGTDGNGDPYTSGAITGPGTGSTVTVPGVYLATVTQITVSGACPALWVGCGLHPEPLVLTDDMLIADLIIEFGEVSGK